MRNSDTIIGRCLQAVGLHGTSDELAREQYRSLARQIPIMYFIISLNSAFMALAVWPYVGAARAFIFPSITIPVMLVRLALWRKRSKLGYDIAILQIRKALKGNVIAAGFTACALGIWCVSILIIAPPDCWPYIPLFAILSIITCAYCLVALPAASYIIVMTGTLFIVVAMIATNDTMLIGMSANISMVSLLVIYMASNQFSQLRRIVHTSSTLTKQKTYANGLAYNDYLTNMPNRRAFVDRLSAITRERPDRPLAVVMIDMNGFKPVNDTYGHTVGDRLLINAGQCLTSVTAKAGMVARLGGDEFAVLFPDPASKEWTQNRVQQMLFEIAKPINIDGHVLRLGAAFGIAYVSEIPDDPMRLMQQADIALYQAKDSKFSAIRFFETEMEDKVSRLIRIEQALSDRDQMADIELHFQPLFTLKSGAHEGFEALARWNHPELGEIKPCEFIEAAERSGLATRLTIHLFRKAMQTARKWPKNIRLSFNLSGSGLAASRLDSILPDILAEFQFDPTRLSIEITETSLLNDPDAVQAILNNLQKIGIRIVLDDFGAGYASIGYLRDMKFDGIKLDGSLIKSIIHSSRSRDLLVGVLHLCKAIGAQVTAEMVETSEQLALLQSLPVDYVQGYLLGYPVAAEDTFSETPAKREMRDVMFKS